MNHSEIILIALILLIIFAGVQIKEFFVFLRGNAPVEKKDIGPVPVKTVLPAEQMLVLNKTKITSKKVQIPKKKSTSKKSSIKRVTKTVAKSKSSKTNSARK